jgi:hypothetical protein
LSIRAVDRASAATGDFVQRADRQSALRQVLVSRLDMSGSTDQWRATPSSRR